MHISASYLQDYFNIAVFLGVSAALSFIIMILPHLLATKKQQAAKMDVYECGFEPFGSARGKFEIRFYLVAILFIIFDLEIAFLFPWAISLGHIGIFGFISMMAFLTVLTVGFIYEWRKGALEWE